jgi:hypothetical protein
VPTPSSLPAIILPVLGVIFLRHAANRFEAATRQIEVDQATSRMPRRPLLPADYLRRRALWLPDHVAELGSELAVAESVADVYDRRAADQLVRQLDEERKAAVEQLKHVTYFHRQVGWLQERFPKAELEAVPGLVKLVDGQEIEATDWSLTPGRYVGVAPICPSK